MLKGVSEPSGSKSMGASGARSTSSWGSRRFKGGGGGEAASGCGRLRVNQGVTTTVFREQAVSKGENVYDGARRRANARRAWRQVLLTFHQPSSARSSPATLTSRNPNSKPCETGQRAPKRLQSPPAAHAGVTHRRNDVTRWRAQHSSVRRLQPPSPTTRQRPAAVACLRETWQAVKLAAAIVALAAVAVARGAHELRDAPSTASISCIESTESTPIASIWGGASACASS